MNNQAAQVGRGVGAGAELGSKMISSGTMRTTLNNPVVDAGMNMANGMDADLAKTVASTTNAKIKAKKAKKEEKTKAIESTAQTALAVTALVVTGGAAAPALGSVLTGTAGGTFYAVQGANIALQAAIGSRTGGPQGALAGVVNGTLQALAATNFGKLAEGADKLLDKADEIQQMAINNPLIAKTMAATNVSYSKENGWGIKANLSGVVNALGVRGGVNFERFTNVTIGQSQRGGASVNLGFNTGKGTLGLNYTGATGKFDGSFDVMERQAGTGKLSAELNYGEDGFSVSGNADLGNGLGFGLESGRNGTTGSLTILGSQQGTVDEDGNYEANSNFLGEISGQDIIDLNEARQAERDAAENERNPVKSAKDAKDAKNAKGAGDAKEARDDDAKEVGGEEGPSGLVDLAFAGLGVVMSAGAAFLAGGGSGSASPSGSAGGQSGAGNGGNANTVVRRPEDELPIGHDNVDPNKGLTRNELSEYNTLQDKLRNGEDLSPEDAERHAQLAEIRNIQVNGNSVADANNGGKVRDTEAEIRRARENSTSDNEMNSRGITDNDIDLVDNILGLAGWAAVNTPLKRPVRPEEDLVGLNKAREENETKLRELQKSLNDLNSEPNRYHISSDGKSSIESRRNAIKTEMDRIITAQENVSRDITRINSHLSELAADRLKKVPSGFQIASSRDVLDSNGNVKERITTFENPNLSEERGSRVITHVEETRNLQTGEIEHIESYRREIQLDSGVVSPVANSNGGITLNSPFKIRYNSESTVPHDGIDLRGSGSFNSPVPIQNITVTGGGAMRMENGIPRGIWVDDNGNLWTYHQPDPKKNAVVTIPYTREMATAENKNYNSLLSSRANGNMVSGTYEANGTQYTLRFMHLQDVSGIKPGQNIGRGQSVGNVGSTGHSETTHGHFQVEVATLPTGIDSKYYRALGDKGQGPYTIDPVYFLNQIAGPNERSLHCDDK